MHVPSLANILLLIYLFVLLPLSSYRSSKRLKASQAARASNSAAPTEVPPIVFPAPAAIYRGTLFAMALTFYITWLAAQDIGFNLFAVEKFGARELFITIGFFCASFAVGLTSRMVRSQQELRTMPALKLVPRTREDWVYFLVVVVVVGVVEESAYRGMATMTLQWMFGSIWLAFVLSAFAFALAHWLQGWKSMIIIFVKGLLMQGMVHLTGTLVGAMVAHSLLDVITAYRTRTLVARLENEARSA